VSELEVAGSNAKQQLAPGLKSQGLNGAAFFAMWARFTPNCILPFTITFASLVRSFMLSVAEAQQLILGNTHPLTSDWVMGLPYQLNHVLAEDIVSDIDSPPFDKAMVDGFAVRSADAASGSTSFKITQEILAGQFSTTVVQSGEAASIMTGAPLPPGADAVVMHEVTERRGDIVTIPGPIKPRQNIMAAGSEMKRDETVLFRGQRLGPVELGILASVGRATVRCCQPPSVAILSTGDELVEPGLPLAPGQIRNSNASLLHGLVQQAHAKPKYLGIACDTIDSLKPLIEAGLQCDVLLITGGVSAGKVDLVPDVLQQLGVTPIFHKVALKPGKPLFFGTLGTRLIFGLPGNPVSGLVNFHLFVMPALRKLMGRDEPYLPAVMQATLTGAFQHKSDRPTYFPVKLSLLEGHWQATPLKWKGSGDLRTLSQATTFAIFPIGEVRYAAGSSIEVLVPHSFS
jgi:molybdopterin molybdotransferase